MCVHRIVAAPTYGMRGEWQTCKEFRREALETGVELGLDQSHVSEENIDDVVMILEKMGHVILSKA